MEFLPGVIILVFIYRIQQDVKRQHFLTQLAPREAKSVFVIDDKRFSTCSSPPLPHSRWIPEHMGSHPGMFSRHPRTALMVRRLRRTTTYYFNKCFTFLQIPIHLSQQTHKTTCASHSNRRMDDLDRAVQHLPAGWLCNIRLYLRQYCCCHNNSYNMLHVLPNVSCLENTGKKRHFRDHC